MVDVLALTVGEVVRRNQQHTPVIELKMMVNGKFVRCVSQVNFKYNWKYSMGYIRDGNNIGKSIPLNECETYAKWHVLPFTGDYANANFPHGCFIHSTGVYYQSDPSTVECSDDAVCLQYGGKGDTS